MSHWTRQTPKSVYPLSCEETRLKVLLAQEWLLERLSKVDVKSICLDKDWNTVFRRAPLPFEIDPQREPGLSHLHLEDLRGTQSRNAAHRPRDSRISMRTRFTN